MLLDKRNLSIDVQNEVGDSSPLYSTAEDVIDAVADWMNADCVAVEDWDPDCADYESTAFLKFTALASSARYPN